MKKANIVVLSGQSNAVGVKTTPATPDIQQITEDFTTAL